MVITKLIDRKYYIFDYCGQTNYGVYGANMKRFYYCHGFISASVCENIKTATNARLKLLGVRSKNLNNN